jgi:signal transduction histidine kinase/CheY-like chemotaxis protein
MSDLGWENSVITEVQHASNVFFDNYLKHRDLKKVKHSITPQTTIITSEKNYSQSGYRQLSKILQDDFSLRSRSFPFYIDFVKTTPYAPGLALVIAEVIIAGSKAPLFFNNGLQLISMLWSKDEEYWLLNHIHFSDAISKANTKSNIRQLESDISRFNIDLSMARNEIRDLKEQTIHLQNEVERAQKASETKNLFVANMSHELRTPVTGIIGMSEILSRKNLSSEQNADLKVIISSSKALLGLINDMMDISRIEAGQLQIRPDTFSIKDLLNKIQTLSNPIAINKKNQLIIHTAPDVPDIIKADKYRLEQVLMNLVNNAMKFTCKGKIYIDITRAQKNEPDIFKISVIDTGIGIKPENQSKLFRQFQQLEVNPENENIGTGLGLYICKKLVLLMGGDIFVESTPGIGSTFWFTFKAEASEVQPLVPIQDLAEEDPWDISLGLKILLVDDKSVNQKVISLMLQTADCQVDIAKNGIEAIAQYNPEKHQVVLMDIMMPVMDGITAMKELRTKYTQTCPIIAITANAMQGDEEKYLSLGFDAYIAKPITMHKLTSHLRDMGMIDLKGQ